MDMIHVSHLSKSLCGALPIPVHDLKVKVTDLEFLCKSFVFKFLQFKFLHSLASLKLMDLTHVWLGDRYWSIPTPVHDL